jgi:hypothetical protein
LITATNLYEWRDKALSNLHQVFASEIVFEEYYFFTKSKVKVFSKNYFTNKVTKSKIFYFLLFQFGKSKSNSKVFHSSKVLVKVIQAFRKK